MSPQRREEASGFSVPRSVSLVFMGISSVWTNGCQLSRWRAFPSIAVRNSKVHGTGNLLEYLL